MKPASVRDVSRLPTFSYGAKNPLWWGNTGFMVIEGLGFIFGVATYLYLYNQNKTWPLGPQPDLLWPSLMTALIVFGEIPNVWLKKAANRRDLRKVRIGLSIMSFLGILAVVIRAFEFTTLNIRWDDNAYGSIVWFMIGLHTTHLVTDLFETFVMTALIHVGPVDMRRFPEVEDNQDYYHFIVAFWLLVYVTVYWLPRWFLVSA